MGVQLPRPDHHLVALVELRQQPRDVRRVVLPVAVHEDDHAPLRMPSAGLDRRAVAHGVRVAHHPGARFPRNRGGVVGSSRRRSRVRPLRNDQTGCSAMTRRDGFVLRRKHNGNVVSSHVEETFMILRLVAYGYVDVRPSVPFYVSLHFSQSQDIKSHDGSNACACCSTASFRSSRAKR